MTLTIKKHLQRKLVKDALALYGGRGLNLAVGLVSTLIYGIIFQRREIAVINLFGMVVSLFISFGFTWSHIGVERYGTEEYHRRKSVNYTSSTRLTIVLPILLLSVLLLFLYRDSLLGYIGSTDRTLILYLILNVVLLVVNEHITGILTAVEKHFWNALYSSLVSIAKISILLIFYLGFLEISAELYLKLNVAWLAVLTFIRIPAIEKRFFLPLRKVRKSDLIRFLKFVLPQIYGFAGLYLINWMDLYFIRKYGNLDDLGAYQFLYIIFMKISSLALLLGTLFFPKVIYWKNNQKEKLQKYVQQSPLMIFTGVAFLIGIFIFIYQPLFSIFFGEKYVVAYVSFHIILLALPFYYVTRLLVPVLNGYDRVAYIQTVNIISAFSNLAIDFFLIREFGIIAAALGTFAAYFIKYFLLLIAVKKMFKPDYRVIIALSVFLCLAVLFYFISNIAM